MKKLGLRALVRMAGFSAVIITGLIFLLANNAGMQGQDMKNMPGMNMSMPKAKTKRHRAGKRHKPTRTRRGAAKKRNTANMLGMKIPGTNTPSSKPSTTTKPTAQPSPAMPMNIPRMQMHAPSPNAQASPRPGMEMNMPMAMASPSPGVSPQQQMNMPGMQMPEASANPHAPSGEKMPMASPSPGEPTGMKGMQNTSAMGSMNMGSMVVMSGDRMAVRVGDSDVNLLALGQMGSGTSWAPASSSLYMWDKLKGNWVVMFHFNAIAGVNSQGGPRGVTKFESANWFMPMAFHKLGKGTLQLRGMFSMEPFTFARGGSPLLFQTGETYNGQPLIDRQHPHDFWMELSTQYTLPVGERGTWFTYFGYPGEPALGPPAFMHRGSALENSSAPLAHHLQDSTHISFGVLTTGFTYRWLKLEGSIFNGREPDENRYNFEAHPWNSRSVRLSFAPTDNWAMQVSYGFLRKPESSEPDTDIRRTTASIQYNRPLKRGSWATGFIWGRNHQSSPGEVHNLNGYTAESTLSFRDKNYLYTRLELVDKNELLRPADRTLLGIKDDHPSFRIGAYTFGGTRDIWITDKLSLAIGSDLTFYSKPAILDRIYGSNPVSWRIFFRLRPSKMDISHMHAMGNMKVTDDKMPAKP